MVRKKRRSRRSAEGGGGEQGLGRRQLEVAGSRETQESSGFQGRGGARGPVRVAGCFCRLPVAPRQSRSGAGVQLAGFQTGCPGGRGRGGPCTAAGARPPAPPAPGARRPAPRPARRCAQRNGPLLPGRPWPLHPARCAAGSPAAPAPPDLSKPRGAVSAAKAFSADKDRRVRTTPKTPGGSPGAAGGSGVCREPQRAAGVLRAGGQRNNAGQRGAPGLRARFASSRRGGLGQMTSPLHPTIRALCGQEQCQGLLYVSAFRQTQPQRIPMIVVRNIRGRRLITHLEGATQSVVPDMQHQHQLKVVRNVDYWAPPQT